MIPRVIPSLLLSGSSLVKTTNFGDVRYIGDPVNVLTILGDFEVDEIILLDIEAARHRKSPDFALLSHLAEECTMPLGFGGGLTSIEDIARVLEIGFEKVIMNTALIGQPDAITEASRRFGSQAVTASIDARRRPGGWETFTHGGTQPTGVSPDELAATAEQAGAGEILITSIDAEGTMGGFDEELVGMVAAAVSVPVVAHGGAGRRSDLAVAIEAGATAVAAGSLFVYRGRRRGVLINYPSMNQRSRIFEGRSDESIEPADSYGLTWTIGTDDRAQPITVEVPSVASTRRACTRCLYDDRIPRIEFDDEGVCSFCHFHDVMDVQYPVGTAGDLALDKVLGEMREAGRSKPFDCIIGVSGGCDSSYLVHELVQRGVRPLAVHFDNTWNSPIATNNIYTVLDRLDVELETLVVDNVEYDDLYRAFMLAGVKDIDIVTDIGFMSTLYRAAESYGIRYIVEGHSFRTEGVAPLDWVYMDGRYIESVHDRFGRRELGTFPNMPFSKFVKWSAFSGIKRIRPLYYLDYHKESAKRVLTDEYGWEWYGGHHLENRWTAFAHLYFLPRRFGIDTRILGNAALVRSGQLTRDEGETMMAEPIQCPPELIALVTKRLGMTPDEFETVMTGPTRAYTDFDSYKRRFERLKPFFWMLYKLDRVPKSFYVKFCGGRV